MARTNKRGPQQCKPVIYTAVRLPPEIKMAVARLSEQLDRSENALMVQAITKMVEKMQKRSNVAVT